MFLMHSCLCCVSFRLVIFCFSQKSYRSTEWDRITTSGWRVRRTRGFLLQEVRNLRLFYFFKLCFPQIALQTAIFLTGAVCWSNKASKAWIPHRAGATRKSMVLERILFCAARSNIFIRSRQCIIEEFVVDPNSVEKASFLFSTQLLLDIKSAAFFYAGIWMLS